MIHVLNYSENIIDDLSFKQDAIYDANHTINIQETMETFDFEVSSKIAQNLRDRHRLLIQDHMGIYREFIIESIVDLESGVTEVQSNASYLEDIRTAKPVKPHSFKDQPPTVMMDYLLADTGWEVSPETEVPMNADFSWDKVTDRLELLKELQDVFNMRLLFYVEVGKNNVEKRYVKLVEVNPIFNGEEIDYKENLIGLKREIDYSEVVTALLGVGPEDSETKKRIYVEVTDDKAQEQFGLPQRYIWDYYEVQVDSETEVSEGLIREETINELERRKKAVVTYDISSTDINAQVGDMIRVKDEDFNPEIYLEAEIVEIHYNLLNNIKEYKFGILKEFTREQVYSQYDKFRKELEERLKEIISNTDSIISERLEEELKYVERYIEKSPTPPLNPKEGDLWLDTTDPKVAILKRYENGKWVKSSVDHVSQIGGLTREETMYETLKERLYRIENSYFEAFKKHDALVTEKHYHYVKDAIKNNLNIKQNELKNSYDDFKIAFNNINSEQPTIGLITTAISRAVEFEAKLKEYNDAYYVARKEFDEVIALLQSQYSEEKFNEAMEEVAEAIGGTFDGTKIIADVPNRKELEDLNTSIKQYLNGEIETLDTELGKKIENILINTKEEIRLGIESVEKKIDGIEIGGRNYIKDSKIIPMTPADSGARDNTEHINTDEYIEIKANKDFQSYWYRYYALSTNNRISDESIFVYDADYHTFGIDILTESDNFEMYINQRQADHSNSYSSDAISLPNTNGKWQRIFITLPLKKDGLQRSVFYVFVTGGKASNPNAFSTNDYIRLKNSKLEKGNKPADWTPAPEDIENKVDTINTTVTKNSSSIGVLENQIALKVNSSEVTQQLNEALKPVKSDIQTNNAELLVQKGLIEQRVTKTDYTTDMNGVVKRLNTSEGKISTLEKEIKLKVTETDVQNKIDELQIGGKNLLKDSGRYIKNAIYNIARYDFVEDLKEGEEVTVQLKGRLGSDRTRFALYNSGGSIHETSIYTSDIKAKRNLAIDSELRSNFTPASGEYMRIQYDLAYNTEVGKTYTVSFDIAGSLVQSDAVTVNNYNSSTRRSQSSLVELKGTKGELTFTATHSGNQILIYKGKSGSTSENYDRTIYIKNVMVVEGSEEAPWTPAWEDEMPIFEKTFNWTNSRIMSSGLTTAPVGQWLNVYQMANGGESESEIEWIKLVRGKQVLNGFTPAPEDTEDRVKKAEGSITVNSDAIKQKVSYTEINKTNKTLERVISELIVDARGISYQYDVNGMIQGFTLNKQYFKLNHNLIDINNGDVVIQNGKTTIKDAFINNLAGNTAFINSLTGKTAFINKIKAIDINAENIRVGFNKIAGSLQVTSTGLEMYDGKTKTMKLDDRGSTFWNGTRLIGRIGSSYLTNDSTVKTLRFALDDPNSMMSWEYKENSSDKNYQMMLQYSAKVQKGHDKRGFIFNDDVSIVPSRVLQLSYIRPLNYTGTGNRVYLSTWAWRSVRGVGLVGGNENGSGVWFGNNMVALFANTSGKAGQGDLDINSDSRSYYVRSETIHDRDYGNSANVCITSNGVLGRATSARKYKEFIELQHETEEKQLEHSKKILQLKPKTWYSKSLLEAVAKEIETGEVDSADDFKIERQFGMIADEFEEVGLTELVQYGKNDEVEGLAYDRISVHHNVLIKDLYDENDALKSEIEELKNKLNKIMEKIK